MDNLNTENTSLPTEPEEQELNHSDKMVGIFSEPKATFEQAAKFPPRTVDWLLPVLILFLLVGISSTILMSNEEIAYDLKQKQRERLQKSFAEAVESGRISEEQAQEQMDKIEDQMNMRGPVTIIITFISILIGGFIVFFIIAAIYLLFAKFVFKGDGSYTSALVGSGLPAYITMVQVILAAILSFAFGRLVNDTSIAAIINADRATMLGWFLAKIDPITIWTYIVVSIGLAKMFKSDSTGKYYALVFGLWIIGGLIFFYIAKSVPFLGNFM